MAANISNLQEIESYVNSYGGFANPNAGVAIASVAGAESQGNPTIVNSIGATGLFQDLGSRSTNLTNFLSASGEPLSSVDGQTENAIGEIYDGGYPTTMQDLQTPGTSVQQIQQDFIHEFENPGPAGEVVDQGNATEYASILNANPGEPSVTGSLADPGSSPLTYSDISPFSDSSSAYTSTAGGNTDSSGNILDESVADDNMAAQNAGNYSIGSNSIYEPDAASSAFDNSQVSSTFNTNPLSGSMITDGTSGVVGNIGNNPDPNLSDYISATGGTVPDYSIGTTDTSAQLATNPFSDGETPVTGDQTAASGVSVSLAYDNPTDVATGVANSTAAPASATPSLSTAVGTGADVPTAINSQTTGQTADANAIAKATTSAANTQAGATTAAANSTNTTDTGIVASIEGWFGGLFVRGGLILLGLVFVGVGLYMLVPDKVKEVVASAE